MFLRNSLHKAGLSILTVLFLSAPVIAQSGTEASDVITVEHQLKEGMVLEEQVYRLSHYSKDDVKTDDGSMKKPGEQDHHGDVHEGGFTERVEERVQTRTMVEEKKADGFTLKVAFQSYSIDANLGPKSFSYSTSKGGDFAEVFSTVLTGPFEVQVSDDGKLTSLGNLVNRIQKAKKKLGSSETPAFVKNNVLDSEYFQNLLSIHWARLPVSLEKKGDGWKKPVKSIPLPKGGVIDAAVTHRYQSASEPLLFFGMTYEMNDPGGVDHTGGEDGFRKNRTNLHRTLGILSLYKLRVNAASSGNARGSGEGGDGGSVSSREAKLHVDLKRSVKKYPDEEE